MKWAPSALGPVGELHQGFVLRDHHRVEPAVVVQVADGQPAAHVGPLERRAGAGRDVGQRPARASEQELRRHRIGEERPMVAEVPVGRHQIEPAVVVGVEESRAETEAVAAGGRQAGGGGMVGEEPLPEVVEQGGGLAVEIRDRQIEAAVAVDIAAGDAHTGLVAAAGVGRDARLVADLLEPEAALVAEQVVGRAVIGHEEVDSAVLVEIGGDDAEPAPIGVDDPRLGGDVHESSAIVAEGVVGQRRDQAGIAGEDDAPEGSLQIRGLAVSQAP